MQITVRCSEDAGELKHFWQSTGFTPASWLLDADMQAALDYVGSVPHGGITHVRIHYLLDLVGGDGFGADSPEYDWSRLDAGLDVLARNGLKPFFELMGNPAGWFSDFRDDAQLHAWRRLVRDLARHLMERYGREEVESWYFESWNEPDIGFGWKQWREDLQAHCNYYDACAEGLREANPDLRLGGAGTCRTLSELFKTFIGHCDGGTNYFSGERGVHLDFISVHEKGVRSCEEDLNPDSLSICEREARIIDYVRRNHPRLADVPFMNNECDPQTGWGQIHTWRARPYYAALAARIIDQHLRRLIDDVGVDYALLSNDNGFLGTWGNRTLVARFGDSDGFELVKKPILNLMVLLSLLGDRRCAAELAQAGDEVGCVATTRGGRQVGVLLYNSRDRIMSSGSQRVRLRLDGVPFTEGMLAHYRIDGAHGDPYAVWEDAGAPYDPSDELLAAMRESHEPALIEEPREVKLDEGSLELEFALPLPAVSLVLLSAGPEEPPARVGGLTARRYPGLGGRENLMLTWPDVPRRFVRTYEVERGPSADGPFERINAADTICCGWVVGGVGEPSWYRVRAVDYRGRAGRASLPVQA